MLIIKNGRIITMTGEIIDGGDILIDRDTVTDMGFNLDYTASISDMIIDAADLFVFPGFIDSHSTCALKNDGIGDIFSDDNPILPTSSVEKYINRYSSDFSQYARAGVTSVLISPPDNCIVGGKCLLAKLTPSDSGVGIEVIDSYSALHISLTSIKGTDSVSLGALSKLRSEINAAKSYYDSESCSEITYSPTLSQYSPVFNKCATVHISAQTDEQFNLAVNLISQYGFKGVIVGLDMVTSISSEQIQKILDCGIHIIIGSGMGQMVSSDVIDSFIKSDIPISICTSIPTTAPGNLPLCAGLAVHNGMDMDSAFESITSSPAKALGSDRISGTIEVGKCADLTIFDDNPVEMLSTALCTISAGRIIFAHKDLMCYSNGIAHYPPSSLYDAVLHTT